MTTICSGPPSTLLSIDAIGKDLLTTLLTSLSLELCIPIFLDRNIDVFRWLGMKNADDFAAIGIDSPQVCQQLALFTYALGRHLNGLPPLSGQEDDVYNNDDNTNNRQQLEKTIQHAVAVFEQYTRPLPSTSPNRQQHQNLQHQKSIRWSSTLSVLGDHASAVPSSSSSPQPQPQSTAALSPPHIPPPPSYEDCSNSSIKKTNKASGLIKRLSLRQRHRPRPMSMPAQCYSSNLPASNDTHLQQQQQQQSTSNNSHLLRRLSTTRRSRNHGSAPPPPPRARSVEIEEQQQRQLQQQQEQRDQYLRQRWEKCRSCVILPRPEEGHELLPPYSVTVYKMGHVYVKREMDTPYTKSRKRAWKKMYVELWGTILRFYQPKSTATKHRSSSFYYSCSKGGFLPPSSSPGQCIPEEDDDTPLASFLHQQQRQQQHPMHLRTFPSITTATSASSSSSSSSSAASSSSSSSSSSATSSTSSFSSPPPSSSLDASSPITIATNATYNLIRRSSRYKQHTSPLDTISLARAEASRAWDYIKRPNALRLTIDQGPQFLLRLPSHIEMISWIEHLQAAINISLDLEFRPMPKFMTLPSRVSATTAHDPRALQLERAREQRFRNQYEMLI